LGETAGSLIRLNLLITAAAMAVGEHGVLPYHGRFTGQRDFVRKFFCLVQRLSNTMTGKRRFLYPFRHLNRGVRRNRENEGVAAMGNKLSSVDISGKTPTGKCMDQVIESLEKMKKEAEKKSYAQFF
jgi:hypothetical protein